MQPETFSWCLGAGNCINFEESHIKIIFVFLMKKLKHQEIESLIQNHIVNDGGERGSCFSYVQRIPLCQDSWGGKHGGHGLSDVVGAGGPCLGLHARLPYSSLTPGNVGHLRVLAEPFFAVCPHRRGKEGERLIQVHPV